MALPSSAVIIHRDRARPFHIFTEYGASDDYRITWTSPRQINKGELAFDSKKKREVTRFHYP